MGKTANGIISPLHPASAAPTSKSGARVKRPFRPRRGWWVPYLFISPFLFFFLVIFLGPTIYSLVLSFFRYQGYGNAKFIGWGNYVALFQYSVFWSELGNTVFYWLVHVIPMMACAFLLAVLVRSRLVKGQSFIKPILFLPNVMAVVAASLIFQSLFGTEYGVINQLLGAHIDWLHNATLTRYVVVALMLWRNTGWWFIVFLVGLTSLNPDMEEAARLDGASSWQRLISIILPLMRNTFLFAFVWDAVGSVRLFTEPNVLLAFGGSMASPSVAPLLNLLVGDLNNGSFGQAASVGWVLFLLGGTVAFVLFRLLGQSSQEEAA